MTTVDHDFVTLRRVRCLDAGEEGLAVLLETRPHPKTGRVQKLGMLLDEGTGTALLKELASALADKYPPKPPKGN